jgi:hypothetical protein
MARQALLIILIIVVFGVLVPWFKGFGFVDPRVVLAYGCMSLLFVAPASAEAAAGPLRDTTSRELLTRLSVLVLWGWGIAAIILLTGMVTLNLCYWRGAIVWPPSRLFAAVLLFSLTSSAMIAALAAVLARRFTANGVKSIFRIGFLAILLAFVFSSRLPERWQIALQDYSTRRAITSLAWEGSAACAAIAVVLAIVLLRARPVQSVEPA